jgi:uncharacterized membrane protein
MDALHEAKAIRPTAVSCSAMSILGRRMFAVAFIAFGLLQFLYGDFIPGRPPAWNASMSGGVIWAYATGAWFVAAGVAIFLGRYTMPAALSVALLVFAWAVTRNTPLALADASFGGAWTRLGKAIALTGGALVVAAASRRGEPGSRAALTMTGSLAFGMFLIASGIQHFLFPTAVTTLVPSWIPGALAWAYAAGVALIAGGAGVIVPATRRPAGIAVGLMIFTWVWILHVPRAVATQPAAQRNEWTAVFEALAFAAIAVALAARPDSIRGMSKHIAA